MNKVLFLTLCIVAGAFARNTAEILAEGPNCPIDDPARVPGPTPINVTLHPLVNIELGSEVSNLIAEGLSSLRYQYDINLVLLTATFDVNITKASGNASYTASGYVDARPMRPVTVPAGNFTGSGLGKLSAENLNIRGSASVFLTITGRVQLSRLVLNNVSFSSLNIDLGTSFNIGGGTVDWAEFSRNIKNNFDEDWAQYRTEVTDKIRLAANNVLKEYTLQQLLDLLEGIGGDC